MEDWKKNEPAWPAPMAQPADGPKYVIPGSHLLDPPYSWQANEHWPFPRPPRRMESEWRAPGTGMIHGGG